MCLCTFFKEYKYFRDVAMIYEQREQERKTTNSVREKKFASHFTIVNLTNKKLCSVLLMCQWINSNENCVKAYMLRV